MKRSGRTIMQRLKDLSYLPSYIGRARYFRGHGVHSPYIYAIVRQVFMRRGLYDESCTLYTELVERGVAKRRAEELTNLVWHCGYKSWSIDVMGRSDIIFATLDTQWSDLEQYADYARGIGATLCIMNPYNNRERWQTCCRIIDNHPSTTVDNRAYLLVFNNHLPKQRFCL